MLRNLTKEESEEFLLKKSTQMILESLPMLKSYIEDKENDLEKLNQIESTFLKLALFFEKPNDNQFELNELLQHLSDDWLLLALNSINTYFQRDTYLIKNPTHSFIDGNNYLNQKDFVEYLNENGEKYSEAKMSVYIQREIIPKPDLILSGTRYWLKSTCEMFLNELQQQGESYNA